MELVAVPQTEDTLLVPRIAAGGVVSGNPISNAGSWISPPPPTTASTQPAANATRMRSASVSAPSSRPAKSSAHDRPAVHRGHDLGQCVIHRHLDLLPAPAVAE